MAVDTTGLVGKVALLIATAQAAGVADAALDAKVADLANMASAVAGAGAGDTLQPVVNAIKKQIDDEVTRLKKGKP